MDMLCGSLAQCITGSGNGNGIENQNIEEPESEDIFISNDVDDDNIMDVDADVDADDGTTDSMDSIRAESGSFSHQTQTSYTNNSYEYEYNSNSIASSAWEEQAASTIPRHISTGMDIPHMDMNMNMGMNMDMDTSIGGSGIGSGNGSRRSSSASVSALKDYLAGAIDELNKIEKIQKQFLSLQSALEVQVQAEEEEKHKQKERNCDVLLFDDCPSDMDSSLPTPGSLEISSYGGTTRIGKQRVEFAFSGGSEGSSSSSSSSGLKSASSGTSSSSRDSDADADADADAPPAHSSSRPQKLISSSSDNSISNSDWRKSNRKRDGSWSDGAMEELRELSDMRTAALLKERERKAQARQNTSLRGRCLLQGTSSMNKSTVSTASKQQTKRVHSHPKRSRAQSRRSRRQDTVIITAKRRHNLERLDDNVQQEFETQKTPTRTPPKTKTISLRDSNRLYDRLVEYKHKVDEKRSALRKKRDFDCARSFGTLTLDQAHSASYLRDTVASRSRSRTRSVCRASM